MNKLGVLRMSNSITLALILVTTAAVLFKFDQNARCVMTAATR